MTKLCPITGKRPSVGHSVSHSNRKTKRRFEPNLITKRVIDPATGKFIRLRMSTKGLRTLTKQMGQ